MKIKMKFYTRIKSNGCVETLCYLNTGVMPYKRFALLGRARQNPLDTHDGHIGRRTALKSILYQTTIPREQRKEIWQHFRENYPELKFEPQETATFDNSLIVTEIQVQQYQKGDKIAYTHNVSFRSDKRYGTCDIAGLMFRAVR